LLIQESLNYTSPQGIVKLIRTILLFTLIAEGIGSLLLAIRFSFDMPLQKAIYYGIFHAVSNFNNAGFDLMGEFRSLTGYVDDPTVTLTICTLIILGGIGFIVVHNVYENRTFRKISLHSKVVLSTTAILLTVGTILIFILEYNNPKTLQPLSLGGKVLASFFHSVTPRTAGSNTLNIPDLTISTLFLTIIFMFIGASPGSTGGGILTELGIRAKYKVNVIAIRHIDEDVKISPGPNYVFKENDILVVIGKNTDLKELEKFKI
jgi:trk system potassium uptake protein